MFESNFPSHSRMAELQFSRMMSACRCSWNISRNSPSPLKLRRKGWICQEDGKHDEEELAEFSFYSLQKKKKSSLSLCYNFYDESESKYQFKKKIREEKSKLEVPLPSFPLLEATKTQNHVQFFWENIFILLLIFCILQITIPSSIC